jgi:hypothetical protein
MLEKMKDVGAHVANKAGQAVDGITTSVKDGVESLTNTATSVTGALNEKAVRISTAQMCRILEIAMEEIKTRPLSEQPVSLTATVNIGIAALQMQVNLPVTEKKSANGAESEPSPELPSPALKP